MSAQTLINPFDFTLAAQANIAWPVERRTIYCSLTGQPWAYVSEEYIKGMLQQFRYDHVDKFARAMDDLILFNGPCVMWQRRVTTNLHFCKDHDPLGFIVYILAYCLKLDKLAVSYEALKAARMERVHAYQAFKELAQTSQGMELIRGVSESMVILSGNGKLPKRTEMPYISLTRYASIKALRTLIATCNRVAKRKARYNTIDLDGGNARIAPNKQHKVITERSLGIEGAPENIISAAEETLLSMLMQVDLEEYTYQERLHAQKIIGTASPTLLKLKRAAADMAARTEAQKNAPVPVVHAVVSNQPVPLKFGAKK